MEWGKLAQEWREKGKKLTQKYRGKEEWLCPRTTGWQGGSGANSPCPTCRCHPLCIQAGATGSSWHVLLPANLEGNDLSACAVPGWVMAAGWGCSFWSLPRLRCTNCVSSLSFPASLVFWPSITPATGKGAARKSPGRDGVKIHIFCESSVRLGCQGSGGGGPTGTSSSQPPSSPAVIFPLSLHPQPYPHW